MYSRRSIDSSLCSQPVGRCEEKPNVIQYKCTGCAIARCRSPVGPPGRAGLRLYCVVSLDCIVSPESGDRLKAGCRQTADAYVDTRFQSPPSPQTDKAHGGKIPVSPIAAMPSSIARVRRQSFSKEITMSASCVMTRLHGLPATCCVKSWRHQRRMAGCVRKLSANRARPLKCKKPPFLVLTRISGLSPSFPALLRKNMSLENVYCGLR